MTADVPAFVPDRPKVTAVEIERGQWSYAVTHFGVTTIIGRWPEAYAEAVTIANYQAVIIDALGGTPHGQEARQAE